MSRGSGVNDPEHIALRKAALGYARAHDSGDRGPRWSLDLEAEALRFAASRIRATGEAGTEMMAKFTESLIAELRDE